MRGASHRALTARPDGSVAPLPRHLRRAMVVVMACCTSSALYAAWELRPLFADGAHYVLRMFAADSYALPEPASVLPHVLQQSTAVLCLRLGADDLVVIERAYGVGTLLLPLLLLGASFLALPRTSRDLFVLPLASYLTGHLSSSFLAQGAPPVAASFFWGALFLVLYSGAGAVGRLAVVAAALLSIFMGVVNVLLAPLLAAGALHRRRGVAGHGERAFWLAIAAMYAIAAAVSAWFVLLPRSPANRASAVYHMLTLGFLARHGSVNVPAVLTLVFAVALAIALLPGRRRPAVRRWVVVTATAAAVVAALSPALSVRAVSPAAQFAARYCCALVIPVFVACLVAVSRNPYWRRELRSGLVALMLVLLAVGQTGWHATATLEWRGYLRDVRTILASHCGLVSFSSAVATLPPGSRWRFRAMSWPWTSPTVSLLLASGGRVVTIIANPIGSGWQPFDPAAADWTPPRRFDATTFRDCVATDDASP